MISIGKWIFSGNKLNEFLILKTILYLQEINWELTDKGRSLGIIKDTLKLTESPGNTGPVSVFKTH